ncbi:tetratricopeptide repeat protein, partial [candidate division KSB1 bacterium]|nr:tetratricopeptide repeat protein [candidate division KSB1 bacterium]
NILSLLHDLEQLEKYMAHSENKKLLSEINKLKDDLKESLGSRKNIKKSQKPSSEIKQLIRNYSVDMDSILNTYELLVKFEKEAQARNDQEVLGEIQKQKEKIIKIIGNYSPQGDSLVQKQLVQDDVDESEKIFDILKEVEQLSARMGNDSIPAGDTDVVKQEMLGEIDSRLLQLSGKKSTEIPQISITELLKEWRAKKTADFQIRLTKYRVLYNGLLKTAAAEEKNRMFEDALGDAMMNYSSRNFDLAEMQFRDILRNYGTTFSQADGIYFYLGETYYARSFYDAAFEKFEELVNNFPQSKFQGQALWKLMLISYTYNLKDKFFVFFDKVKDLSNALSAEEQGNAYYLAGYLYATNGDFKKSRTYLEMIQENTPYYLPGQYLLGIVYINLENFTKAKKILEAVGNAQNYPWSDVNLANLRNEAIIRLGFLHYHLGEYQKAVDVLGRVSQGYEGYDKSLMAQAWAELKTGKYEDTISKVNQLLSKHLTSNFTYEALVVSAHCKRILNRPEEAKADLDYISSAQTAMELSNQYYEERKRIMEQAKELERLESSVLERQDQALYEDVSKIRGAVQEALIGFNYQGFASKQLLEDFTDERKKIVRQIEYFDSMIQQAKTEGQEDMLLVAEKQKARLISLLENYDKASAGMNVNAFITHPLATKEGGIRYRRGMIKNMVQDMLAEKKQVERDIQNLSKLIESQQNKTGVSAEIDLELLQEDLASLKNQLNRLQIWLANNAVDESSTNFEKWADFSGFGMSDINFSSLLERERKIATYSENIEAIERLLAKKRKSLESKVTDYDQRMLKLIENMNEDKARVEKQERKKYFDTIYFDTKQKEVERQVLKNEYEKILEEELKRGDLKETLEKNKTPEQNKEQKKEDE